MKGSGRRPALQQEEAGHTATIVYSSPTASAPRLRRASSPVLNCRSPRRCAKPRRDGANGSPAAPIDHGALGVVRSSAHLRNSRMSGRALIWSRPGPRAKLNRVALCHAVVDPANVTPYVRRARLPDGRWVLLPGLGGRPIVMIIFGARHRVRGGGSSCRTRATGCFAATSPPPRCRVARHPRVRCPKRPGV